MLNRICDLLTDLAKRLNWLPPTLTRLSVGMVFAESGWGKLHDLPKVVAYFTELGIPAPQIQAPFVAGVEFVGGSLLLLGLATRLAAVPLMGTMVVAIVTAKRADIESFGDLVGLSEFLLLTLLVWLAIAGAGPLSIDRFIKKRR